jgi:hypothetical protein
MDNVLVPYLTADDEREREQHLDELLTRHAAPLIRQVLRRKFGIYVNGQGINKNSQDAEDLYQEAMTRVVQVLNQLQASSTPTDIENFKAYEAAAAAVHMADCQDCHQRFVAELNQQRGSIPFSFTLDPEFWFRDDHVDFDLLVELADETLDQDTQEIIGIHLKTCETCREDVRSFLAFRKTSAGEMNVSYARPDYESIQNLVAAAPWWRGLTRPSYAIAAVVLLAIAGLIGVIALNKRSGPLEASNKDQANIGAERNPDVSPSRSPDTVSTPASVDDSAQVAKLNDGGGEVTIDKNGQVSGLDNVSETSRQYIARAALSEQIQPADVLRRLSGQQSGLRGDGNNGKAFKLLYPLRRVVTEDKPTFKWESLSGVTSYRVYILDANSNLPPTQTQWKPPTPLRRGQIFSWVVTALIDGKEIISPSASAPEVKFAILSSNDLNELNQLKKSDSHLGLGIFYARVGLVTEAEREFQKLIQLNPQSALPRKLLQSVRNVRKAN